MYIHALRKHTHIACTCNSSFSSQSLWRISLSCCKCVTPLPTTSRGNIKIMQVKVTNKNWSWHMYMERQDQDRANASWTKTRGRAETVRVESCSPPTECSPVPSMKESMSLILGINSNRTTDYMDQMQGVAHVQYIHPPSSLFSSKSHKCKWRRGRSQPEDLFSE